MEMFLNRQKWKTQLNPNSYDILNTVQTWNNTLCAQTIRKKISLYTSVDASLPAS